MLGGEVDTIFEIGGQDSKFISIEDGVVVDFTMNDACAAGTGSFLEEQAEDLGVNIKGEFAQLALSSERPVRLGERCTVFMAAMSPPACQYGVPKEDIIAGLASSVVTNYLNRVVRGRKIGEIIFFRAEPPTMIPSRPPSRWSRGRRSSSLPTMGHWCHRRGPPRETADGSVRDKNRLQGIRSLSGAIRTEGIHLQGMQQFLHDSGVRYRWREDLLGGQVL